MAQAALSSELDDNKKVPASYFVITSYILCVCVRLLSLRQIKLLPEVNALERAANFFVLLAFFPIFFLVM